MTDPKEKNGPVVPTRTPKKKTPGIFDNLRKMPQPHPVEEMLGLITTVEETAPSTPSRGGRGSTPSTLSSQSKQTSKSAPSTSVSPERDFSKVANSIVRTAVPSGIFGENGGKSKQLYDYLYSQTRGAIMPSRKIRIPKEKLMKAAGIGSDVTLRKNLQHLRDAQLVKEEVVPGAHGGNEYEVFTPEEISLTPSTPSTPSRGGYPLSKLEGLPPLEATPSRGGLSQADATTYGECKTFLKDLSTNDDDEAFAGLLRNLRKAVVEVTGRGPTAAESARWAELGEVLITELKIAATRTTVSNVPAFLTEHLRRRLWKMDKKQMSSEGKSASTDETPNISTEQVKDCSDCGGTGFYYPQGFEGGVAKCKHERPTEGG